MHCLEGQNHCLNSFYIEAGVQKLMKRIFKIKITMTLYCLLIQVSIQLCKWGEQIATYFMMFWCQDRTHFSSTMGIKEVDALIGRSK
jgi:hypothetical protein